MKVIHYFQRLGKKRFLIVSIFFQGLPLDAAGDE